MRALFLSVKHANSTFLDTKQVRSAGIFFCKFTDPRCRRLKVVHVRQNSRDEARLCPVFWAGGRKGGVLQAPLAASDLNRRKTQPEGKEVGNGPISIPTGNKTAHPPIITPTSQDPN